MISPTSLRPGNWIYPTGRSKYVEVTGLLLGMMEKNEDLCKEFEGIELTGELLEAAGFKNWSDIFWTKDAELMINQDGGWWWTNKWEPDGEFQLSAIASFKEIHSLHQLQNLYFALTGSELPLPESALIIPQTLEK